MDFTGSLRVSLPLRKYSIDHSARMQVVTGDALDVRWAKAYEPLGLMRAFGENEHIELEMVMTLRGELGRLGGRPWQA